MNGNKSKTHLFPMKKMKTSNDPYNIYFKQNIQVNEK